MKKLIITLFSLMLISNASLEAQESHTGIKAGLNLSNLIVGFNYNLGFTPVAKEGEISRDMLGNAKNAVIQVYAGIHF